MTTTTPTLRRRRFLAAAASAGAGALAGCSLTSRESDGETTATDPETARDLAARFAPTLYFDAAEPWLPTDPRPYASRRDGESIVTGFDALDGYHERYAETGEPPDPTVFYNVVEYEASPLAVVQFWLYSAFDQFTTNFHWHDWEVLHVFVDTDTGRPQLYVASSHSRKVPNNEFLDPDPEMGPRLLSELGSHSSALSVNDRPDEFQRLPGADLLADITNSAVGSPAALSELPLAYGLPRDEGARLPYVVPEYEGAPVYEHDRLPNVDRESLVPAALTVRTFDALSSPPTELPGRTTGVVFRHRGRDASATAASPEQPATSGQQSATSERQSATSGQQLAEYAYELVPTDEIEHLTAFTGPQLSFEFAVPQIAEDAIASHISTTGVPWTQPRYVNPAADITDPNHRAVLAARYDAIGAAAPINTVVARVTEAVTTDEAPENEGLTTESPSVEAVALLESESTAVPTFRGVAVVQDVPDGQHRLTVNAAGRAPHSERLSVGPESNETAATTMDETAATTDETAAAPSTATPSPESATTAASSTATPASDDGDESSRTISTAGVDGEIPLVAREDARKLEVDAAGTEAELAALGIEDDFAGRVYDAPLDGSDAVYLHHGGAYTTEVRDVEGAIGAFRVNPVPDAADPVRIDRPETGKASLSSFLVAIAAETQEAIEAFLESNAGALEGRANAIRGLVRALGAVVDAAQRATESARAGNRANADRKLRTVATALERVVERLDAVDDDLPDPLSNAAQNRAEQAVRRAAQARRADKL